MSQRRQRAVVRDLTDANGAGVWRWRTPLAQSQAHWRDWFVGASQRFVAAPCPRLLLLAADLGARDGGADRLDAELTAAHIQGKFVLRIVRNAGHALHEDQPAACAGAIVAFLDRMTRALPAAVAKANQ